jgi:stage II sporulation protein D
MFNLPPHFTSWYSMHTIQRLFTAWLVFFTFLAFASNVGTGCAWAEMPLGIPVLFSHNGPVKRDIIRVGISDNAMVEQAYFSVAISAAGPFTLHTGETDGAFKTMPGQSRLFITAQNGKLMLQTQGPNESKRSVLLTPALMHITRLWIKPDSAETPLKVLNITRKGNTPQYRGMFEVTIAHHNPNRLMIVNRLPMNDYLRAVVPNELPIRFGREAVRAQAVAARNYALRPRETSWPEFDICDSQMCQAYYGKQTETAETDEMLRNTEGLVLLHEDKLALTLYSSSHGGVSEAYSNAFSDPKTQQFPAPALPYLVSVADDATTPALYPNLRDEATLLAYLKDSSLSAYDKKSPHFRWKATLNYTTLSNDMAVNLKSLLSRPESARWIETQGTVRQNLGRVTRLEALERGASGKLMRLKVHTTTGSIIATKELIIRRLLKYQGVSFKSATIAFESVRGSSGQDVGVTVYGTGFGHGVGMSQYGASGMHDANIPFPDILEHYYPNTQLGSVPLFLERETSQEQRVHGVPGRKAFLHVLLPPQLPALKEPLIVQVNQYSLRLPPFENSTHRVYDISAFMAPDAPNTVVWPKAPPTVLHMDTPKVWLGFQRP